MWSFHDRQEELWALVRRNDTKNHKLAIFVHGFRGTHLTTWGELSDYLRKHAHNDPVLKQWDYLFIGYESHSIDNYLNIAELIAGRWKLASLAKPPFAPNRYTKLALLGHSLGTLGIRQLLCAKAMQPRNMLKALHSVVLLGSPLNGSPLARFGRLSTAIDIFQGKFASILPGSYSILHSLEPDGAPMKMLHAWNKTARFYLQGTKVHVQLGTDDQVVGDGAMVDWEGDEKRMTPFNHSELCKLRKNVGQRTEGHILDLLREHLDT